MPAALLALLPQIIALIPTITSGVSDLISFIASVRLAAQQSQSWTPELETAFLNSLIEKGKSKAWQTDREISQ